MAYPTLLSFLTSWVTPTSLFIFLNIIIGTIFLTSLFASSKNEPHDQPLARSPSLLERVKSFNFSHYNFPPPESVPGYPQDPPQLERAPSLLERVRSINLSSLYSSQPNLDQNPGLGLEHQVKMSKSEPMEEKMVAVVGENEKVGIDEEDRAKSKSKSKSKPVLERTDTFGDEAVDAKADDFINRFKQQLKLQRLDSLLRYKQRNA